ncbi:MAG: ABC transporter ATP-binding protein [Pseudomonadota bacterium]
MLDIENLAVSLPTEGGLLEAVRGVDLKLAAGETLAVVGESGCGKSMTALAVMGLLPRSARMSAHRLAIAGRDYAGAKVRERAKLRGREMALIFQDATTALNPTLTVGKQLTEGAIRAEKLSRRAAVERAVALLERVGIPRPADRLGQYPHEFSGGQRQRIMIAMALMGQPRILIADEPTTALDVTIQAQILALLGELQKDLGLALLLITHDLGVVAAIADRVAVMYAGRVVEEGSADAVFRRPGHPYTRGLIDAIPVPGVTQRGTALAAIPGRVPGLIGGITGCAFRARCPRARPDCAHHPVPQHIPEGGRVVECVAPLTAMPTDRVQADGAAP